VFRENKSCNQMVVSPGETVAVRGEDGSNSLIIVFCSSRNFNGVLKIQALSKLCFFV